MDIQGWLQGTTDRAPPDPSDGLPIDAPAFIQSATAERGYHRKRPRAASDSSIIAPQRRADDRGKASDHLGNPGSHRHVNLPVSRPGSPSRHDTRSSVAETKRVTGRDRQAPAKPYAKRARHKTKTDRYEPMARKGREKTQHAGHADPKPRRKRERPHRGGDGKRTEGLVQGFKLKNGPKNSRLTLKQDASAGLFKHGRASAQVQGRNAGLPDLVFNELRFLQNSKDHQDEQHANDTSQNPANQHKRPDDDREEISAYFSKHNRHNLARHSPVATQKAAKRVLAPITDLLSDASVAAEECSSPVLRDEELPAVPYLGFGSRGTVNHSSRNPRPSSSTSYLTWSESVVEPTAPLNNKPGFGKGLEAGQLSAPKQMHSNRPNRSQEHVRPQHTRQNMAASEHDGPDGPPPNLLTKKRRPPLNEIVVHTDDHEPDLSTRENDLGAITSQSLPTAPRNPGKLRGQDVHQQHQMSSSGDSFHTSDILKLRGRLQTVAEQSSPNVIHHTVHNNKENAHPSTTSPTAKALRAAQEAMMQNHRDALSKPSRRISQQPEEMQMGMQMDMFGSPPPASPLIEQQISNRYMQELDHNHVANHLSIAPALQEYGDIHQHLAEEQYAREGDLVDSPGTLSTYPQGMLLHGSLAEMSRTPGNVLAPTSDEGQLDRRLPSRHARDHPWSRSGLSTTFTGGNSSYNTFAARDPQLHEDFGGDRTLEEGLEGFWRPHRLY